ncbi:lysine-N-methylase [Paenibacillus ginsengarvi]|uniref:Lysine-N-methylase n=2 Tax=Paenibacillus ginsengarvi TaxID=400777 RepID=A0A3B0C0K5_9BACL|nr:lysine-N-methylase [Paenibacillus ginsengarvi]
MNRTKHVKHLYPQYMDKFQCIGSECEDTCCAGWQVSIDRPTYKKYSKVADPHLRKELDSSLKRNRFNPSDGYFASIKLNEKNHCPMLTEDRRCGIQLRLGEEYLSNVCASYPRGGNVVNGVYELSGTISCPEMARLVLLNPDGIEFQESSKEYDRRINIGKVVQTADPKSQSERYLWEFRIFTIQVLQNRNYELTDRLILLGMFFQKSQECMKEEESGGVVELIAKYTSIVDNGNLKDVLQDIPSNTVIQMELLKELADERYRLGVSSQRYFECYAAFLHGIEYNLQDTTEDIALRYKDGYENYYQPFMKEHGYIIENYLVNHVYKSLFPCGKYETLFDEFIMLVLHYALIKMHLIGMARYAKEEFTIDFVIKLMQSFSKTVEHNNTFFSNAYQLLEKHNYKSMAYMAILIKN